MRKNQSKNKNIIAIIPARGGSKGIPKKNIVDLAGFPLIAYSIALANLSKLIERIIVSTDSEEIAEISKKYGAEVPFLRPKEFARDDSPDIEFFQHALDWFRNNEDSLPKYFVHLRPTTPLREPEMVDEAIRKFLNSKEATSLCSGHQVESPYKEFQIKDGFFEGLFPDDSRPDYFNLPRQTFPSIYYPNGYVDIIKTQALSEKKGLYGPKILSFITPAVGDIDRLEDLDHLEFDLKRKKYKIYEFLKINFK